MKNVDFTKDLKELFNLGDKSDNEESSIEKEHAEEEHEDVSSEAESDEVAETSEEGEEPGVSHEESPDEGDDERGRETLEDDDGDEEEEEEAIEPPSHWKKADREQFSDLPVRSQKFLLNQSKHFQADYMRKVNDVKGLVEALEPLKEQMAKGGVSRAQAVRSLVKTHLNMMDTPAEAMKQLFVDYGVDPVEFVSKWDDIQSFNDKIKDARNKGASEEQRAVSERSKNTVVAKLTEWAKDKEHAELVEPQMAAIVTSHIRAGTQPPHIDDIYEEALWMNPKTRKTMQEKESLKTSVKEKRRLNRSKKAADASVKKESQGKTEHVGSNEMSQREELAHLLDKAG